VPPVDIKRKPKEETTVEDVMKVLDPILREGGKIDRLSLHRRGKMQWLVGRMDGLKLYLPTKHFKPKMFWHFGFEKPETEEEEIDITNNKSINDDGKTLTNAYVELIKSYGTRAKKGDKAAEEWVKITKHTYRKLIEHKWKLVYPNRWLFRHAAKGKRKTPDASEETGTAPVSAAPKPSDGNDPASSPIDPVRGGSFQAPGAASFDRLRTRPERSRRPASPRQNPRFWRGSSPVKGKNVGRSKFEHSYFAVVSILGSTRRDVSFGRRVLIWTNTTPEPSFLILFANSRLDLDNSGSESTRKTISLSAGSLSPTSGWATMYLENSEDISRFFSNNSLSVIFHLLPKGAYRPKEFLSVKLPVILEILFSKDKRFIVVLQEKRSFLHFSVGMNKVAVGEPVSRIITDHRIPFVIMAQFQLDAEIHHFSFKMGMLVPSSTIGTQTYDKFLRLEINHATQDITSSMWGVKNLVGGIQGSSPASSPVKKGEERKEIISIFRKLNDEAGNVFSDNQLKKIDNGLKTIIEIDE
ncbi:MAG: hypothetical protein AABY66_04450, partial [Nitrospirota bacterium]